MSDSSSSVAAVSIVVIVLLAIAAFFLLFGRGVSAKKGIDVNINTPKNVIELPSARWVHNISIPEPHGGEAAKRAFESDKGSHLTTVL